MSMLAKCHDYCIRFRNKNGYYPTKIYLYEYQLAALKDEVQWELTHPCETPSPDTVYGMEIIVVGEDL